MFQVMINHIMTAVMIIELQFPYGDHNGHPAAIEVMRLPLRKAGNHADCLDTTDTLERADKMDRTAAVTVRSVQLATIWHHCAGVAVV